MTTETILLALLVFAMVVTRPFEEGRWRAGRMSDRTSALLVVARLPILVLGFALITGPDPGRHRADGGDRRRGRRAAVPAGRPAACAAFARER